MKILECKDSISRFRFAQSCVGLTGCLCVTYAVWTPFWLKERGIWTEWNITKTDHDHYSDGMVINGLQAQRVFGVISFLTAVSTAALCLVFALCWTSETVRSYSNTRALLMAGQALYPTTLLLLTMLTTGFFFPPLLVPFHLSAPGGNPRGLLKPRLLLLAGGFRLDSAPAP
ncbi:uncharacterized protein ACB058_008587 [Synchiropus picturatus]